MYLKYTYLINYITKADFGMITNLNLDIHIL